MSKMKKAKSLGKPKVDNSRKAIRKQKRLQKKQHRQEHYMKKKELPKTEKDKPKYTPGRFVKRPPDDVVPEVVNKKKKTVKQPQSQDILLKERAKEKKEENKLKSQMEEQRRQMMLKANEEEDKLIKKLEKQLGLKKSKNKNNYFADDGLDYLLEICDRSTTEQIVAAEKHLAEVEGDSDFEEDLAAVTGKDVPKKKKKNRDKDASDLDDDGSLEDGDGSLGEDDEAISGDEELSDDEALSGDEEFSGEDNESVDFDEDSDGSEPEEKPTKTTKSKQKEKPNKTKNNLTKEKPKSKEKIIKAEDLSKVFSDDEISHLSGDDDELSGTDDDLSGDEGDEKEVEKNVKPDVWEDIYGRKRDKDGNVIKEEKGVYIPPHLRNKDSSSDKQLEQLRRQIKSILNKVSGSNLHWACSSLEALYASHSRHSVSSSLTRLWSDATVGVSPTPDRLVAEHAALVAVLHANVGSEIGAHFLQDLCKRFEELTQTPQPVEDKTLDNVISCIAHLYSFKVCQATLIYDILTRLTSTISEKSVECVVCGLRCVGAALRRDQPAMLKEFIHKTQDGIAGVAEGAGDGSRIKFLLEILMAVKNNNLTKIPNYDPSYQEHLKKMIKSIIRKGNYITPLNIGLEDLLKADERGKWWVVGSAWEGAHQKQDPQTTKPLPAHDQKLLELARKQRMNTDVRRSIFCVIMAAEDYMDAFEKLQHLGLKGQQEREVVHVLLACCLQEKTYNPYYGVLAQKLCDYDRKYQLSIQYSVWDKIKDIENQTKLSLTNLAQFLVHLIMEKGLPLSVLKIIQFSDLNKQSVRFMRQILLAIIMNQDLQSSLEVFHRISKPPKLHMFRESLKLFIQHFLVKNAGRKNSVLSDEDMEVLRQRAAEVNKILTLHESKLKL